MDGQTIHYAFFADDLVRGTFFGAPGRPTA